MTPTRSGPSKASRFMTLNAAFFSIGLRVTKPKSPIKAVSGGGAPPADLLGAPPIMFRILAEVVPTHEIDRRSSHCPGTAQERDQEWLTRIGPFLIPTAHRKTANARVWVGSARSTGETLVGAQQFLLRTSPEGAAVGLVPELVPRRHAKLAIDYSHRLVDEIGVGVVVVWGGGFPPREAVATGE